MLNYVDSLQDVDLIDDVVIRIDLDEYDVNLDYGNNLLALGVSLGSLDMDEEF